MMLPFFCSFVAADIPVLFKGYYVAKPENPNECPKGYRGILEEDDCNKYAANVLPGEGWAGVVTNPRAPNGCFLYNQKAYFNNEKTNTEGITYDVLQKICVPEEKCHSDEKDETSVGTCLDHSWKSWPHFQTQNCETFAKRNAFPGGKGYCKAYPDQASCCCRDTCNCKNAQTWIRGVQRNEYDCFCGGKMCNKYDKCSVDGECIPACTTEDCTFSKNNRYKCFPTNYKHYNHCKQN